MPTAFQRFQSRLGISNPARKNIGFNWAPITVQQGQQTPGQMLSEKIGTRKDSGAELYAKGRSDSTSRLGADLVSKSAYQVPTDEFGMPKTEITDFRSLFDQQLGSIGERGKYQLQTQLEKNEWGRLKNLQDLGQYSFTGNIQVGPSSTSATGTDIPGASANNPGAKAVSLAMKAYRNHTPYVWGGNSLTRGIDCSGLVQQVYRQLGISLPRTTYEQAKSGRRVPVNTTALRPGDLLFYNTGSRDPNGIGRYGHVGIYMGNGQIVEAANSRVGMRVTGMNNANGYPSLAIRPY